MSNKSILQSNNESLSANNLDLQSLIDQANALPEAGGVKLPELSNPANADEVFSGKQLIDGDGEVVTGTFTIDNELDAQDDLISQIQTALQGKASGVILPALSKPATAENLEKGYELIDGDGNIVVGTHVCGSGGEWQRLVDLDKPLLSSGYYLELDDDINCVLFTEGINFYMAYWSKMGLSTMFFGINVATLVVQEVDEADVKTLEIFTQDADMAEYIYYMPVHGISE